jgi:hypothetical protein
MDATITPFVVFARINPIIIGISPRYHFNVHSVFHPAHVPLKNKGIAIARKTEISFLFANHPVSKKSAPLSG